MPLLPRLRSAILTIPTGRGAVDSIFARRRSGEVAVFRRFTVDAGAGNFYLFNVEAGFRSATVSRRLRRRRSVGNVDRTLFIYLLLCSFN